MWHEPKPLIRRSAWPALVLFGCLAAQQVGADAFVMTRAMTATTIAEVFVEPESIRLELEIGLADLPAFADLLPDPLFERLGHEPEPMPERLMRFFGEGMVLRADAGAPLVARVERMEARPRIVRDEITGQILPGEEKQDEPVLVATLVYTLAERPEFLVIEPPLDEAGFARANIGFVVFHRGLPVMDFRYLGSRSTLRLDWADPWYSKFDNRNLRRQYEAPLSGYLYVEPFEVRKEIVIRPADLRQWIDLGLRDRDVIAVSEQQALKRNVAAFLAERNPVLIDGRPVDGTLDRINFIYRNLRTSGVVDPPRDLDLVSATLGAIFVYPTEGLPQEVTMEWELFGERIQRVPAVATDEAGGMSYLLTPDDRVLKWQNFLRNPTIPGLVAIEPPARVWSWAPASVAGLCVLVFVLVGWRYGRRALRGQRPPARAFAIGLLLIAGVIGSGAQAVRSGRLPDDEADAILNGLLKNVYRAFDYRDENVIYDTLAQSVSGELLTDTYLETRRSLELENQGGARAKVNDVERVESSHESLGGEKGFVSRYTWVVSGSVGHWGHVHQRKNRYDARVVVKAIDGAWKITELELLQEQRL